MGLIVYHNMSRIVEREVSTISMDALMNTKKTIDAVLRDADVIATHISIQPEIRAFFLSDGSFPGTVQRYDDAYRMIRTFPLVHRYIDSIYIYSSRRNLVLSTRESGSLEHFTDNGWYDTYKQKEDNLPWIQGRARNNHYPYYISVVRPPYIYDTERLGAVIVNINVEELEEMVRDEDDAQLKDFFVLDDRGKIVVSRSPDMITMDAEALSQLQHVPPAAETSSRIAAIDGEKYIVSTIADHASNWRYVSFISLRTYSEQVDWVQRFIAAFLIAGILFALVIAAYLSYRSFVPIRNIIHLIDFPEDWKIPKRDRGMNELKYIANKIVSMVSNNKQLQKELETRLTMLDKAHTSALQAQINPHFLYNTLESIHWLAAISMGKTNKVSETIANLSTLLRLSLDSDEEITTLSKEVEHARCYIDIMKVRYADKFEVLWDIPPSLGESKIIKLCLQPVIENAIYHGLKQSRNPGTIFITARAEKQRLIVQVRDNGVGLSDERIEEINANLNNDYVVKGKYIGLRNIAQRIKIVFGDEYGVSIQRGSAAGLKVLIILPLLK